MKQTTASVKPLDIGRRSCVGHAAWRRALLASSSLGVLSLFAPPMTDAWGAQFGSKDYFNQLGARQGSSATLPGSQTALPLTALAQQIAQRSANDLALAAHAIAAQQSLQTAAQAAAQAAPSTVPDGLVTGGLAVAPGVASDPSLWVNAAPPSSTSVNGETTVTIDQTGSKAILTWQSFNVGKNTTVYFDQQAGTDSAGNNGWIALNRIIDPSGVPSQILGSLKADGSVYLIDRNGIEFGGSSQVDLHALVASSLDIGRLGQTTAQRDAQFLQLGLNVQTATGASSLPGLNNGNVAFSTTGDPLTSAQEGAVTVDAGARITTTVQGSDNPGSVMLLAPNISNAGSITSPSGQVILAAGRAFAFLENTSVDPSNGENYLGLLVQSAPSSVLVGSPYFAAGLPNYQPEASVLNSGLIQTSRGNITLSGTTAENDGVLAATTSITRNGSIVVDGATTTSFGPNAVAAILPEANGETIPQGQVSSTTFSQPYVQIQAASIGAQNTGGDAVVGVGQVTIGAGAAIVAPGATIGVFGGQSVYMSADSLIDAAGLTSAVLPMSANYVVFTARGPELADSPLQRGGPLNGASITIDVRDSGVTADGRSWVGTSLADASGYVSAIPETIQQLLSAGGSVSLSTALGDTTQSLDNIVLRSGSSIDVSGGYVTYQGGTVATTRLLGADGQLYSLASADPNRSYVGIAGSFSVSHPHWAVTTTYDSPLVAGAQAVFEPGYIEGHDAGGINLRADAIVDDATLLGQAVAGPRQKAAGDVGTASSAYSGDARHLQANAYQLPSAGYLQFNPTSVASANPTIAALEDGTSASETYVLIQGPAATLPASFTSSTVIATAPIPSTGGPFAGINPADIADTLVLSTDLLNAGGFAEISARGRTRELAGTSLTVADGGKLAFAGEDIDIQGILTARSGTISLTSNGTGDPTAPPDTPSIVIEDTAVLDTRGRWTNDTGNFGATVAGPAFVNGGTIDLVSDARSSNQNGTVIDTTGGIVVAQGARLDVSGGGYVKPDGTMLLSGGVPAGSGGNIALETYVGGFSSTGESAPLFPASDALAASVSIDLTSSVEAFGFSGGGKLTIRVGPTVEITDTADRIKSAADGTLLLPSTMFGTGNPFGSFDIGSDGGSVVVAAGTHVKLAQDNLQYTPLTTSLPTDGDVYAAAAAGSPFNTIGTTPAFFREPVNLTLSTAGSDIGFYPAGPIGAGRVVVQPGAVIEAAPSGAGGSTITLDGFYQTSIYGAVEAPGGLITVEATGNTATGLAELGSSKIANGAVYLAPGSFLDVSGRTVIDTENALYRSGTVLGGGEVELVANGSTDVNGSFGYVAAAAGSRIDLDGASGVLQYLVPGASGTTPVDEAVSTDAGELLVDATAAVLSGAVNASGGGAGAANGILTITSSSAPDVILRQTPRALPPGYAPRDILTELIRTSDKHHEIVLAGKLLENSQFDDINIGAVDPTSSNGGSGVNIALFQGDVSFDARRALRFYAPIELAPTGSDTNPRVSVSAPYILFATTSSNLSSARQNSFGTFDATADLLVLQRGWVDANAVNLVSTGDVQVSAVLNSTDQNYGSGGLVSVGALTIAAADIYPTGGVAGVIQAIGPDNGSLKRGVQPDPSLTIRQSGTAEFPLSAGGALYLLAADIVQDGTVLAPGGTIVLGNSTAPGFFTFLGTEAGTPTVVSAKSVTFGPGSVTSVSLDGADLPYGGTVDGRQWFYGDDPNRSNSPLTSLPSKQISVTADSIDLSQGATIDLSGSGDLYATEFVPGNGGTRNVLSTENSYTPTAFDPHNVGNDAFDNTVTQVYAILPSGNPRSAPSDLDFSTATGLGTQSVAPGLSVTLSGVGGIPAGTYTLLPAAYATLPGAYRVVVTGVGGFVPSENAVLADGSYSVSGSFATPIAGEQSSLPQQFLVQSSAVWRQYSEIDQTSGNTFFAQTGGATSFRVPQDSGHLILSATTALNLAGTLDSSAPAGALGSLVDISGGDTEILDPGQTARAGYVGLDADQLSALDAGSLLIGGTRIESTAGDVILATSRSIVVDNDAAHPLVGPEILLATTGDTSGTDPNAGAGLTVSAGAVIEAEGAAAKTTSDLVIGYVPTGQNDSIAAYRGDGAFLGVTTGAELQVARVNLPGSTASSFTGSAQGNIVIAADAVVSGGNDLIIDTADTGTLDPAARLSASSVTIAATDIGIGSAPSGAAGLIISGSELGALAGLNELQLHGRDAITFYGDAAIDQTGAASVLLLDSGSVVSAGGAVKLTASTVEFENLSGGPASNGTGNGSLRVSAGDIMIGEGAVGISGVGQIALNASQQLVGSGAGSFDAGSAALTIATPQLVAATGSTTSIETTGTLTVSTTGAAASGPGSALGGALTLEGASVSLASAVLAPSGRLTIEATRGDVTLGSGAILNVAGVAQAFFDVTRYSPGGTVTLLADTGDINVAQGAEITVAGAAAGGGAGTLTVRALAGRVVLDGSLDGASKDGLGGSFSLLEAQSQNLDTLAAALGQAGFHDAIGIETNAGDLSLTGRLTASSVALTADAGEVLVGSGAVIDATGAKGGTIELFGARGVDVEGQLLAQGSDPTRAGGLVEIGTGGTFDGTYNPLYGYENMSSAGPVVIGADATINVSGGTIEGLTGGVLLIRSPLLENDTIDLTAAAGAQIIGAHDVIVDAFAKWSASDTTTGTVHFDGIVDPAGWYDSLGQLLAGQDQKGNTIAAGSTLAPGTYFTPASVNADHVGFYQQTLMNFVRTFNPTPTGDITGLGRAELQPGIDLVNDTTTINQGDIVVATAWNLGAGGYDSAGNLSLFYRTPAGQPGDLTLRAANDLRIDASITDGFFQSVNSFDPRYLSLLAGAYLDAVPKGNSTRGGYVSPLETPQAPYDTSDATYNGFISQYYSIYQNNYIKLYTAYRTAALSLSYPLQALPSGAAIPAPPTAPVLGQPSTYGANSQSYQAYVNYYKTTYVKAYTAYLRNAEATCTDCAMFQPPASIEAPPAYGATMANATGSFSVSSSLLGQYGANGVSPNATTSDPDPILSSSLFPLAADPSGTIIGLDGTHYTALGSWSIGAIGGADTSGVQPLAVKPLASFAGGGGDVLVEGHTTFTSLLSTETGLVPTVIRTGTGSIDIAAGDSVSLTDPLAPGAIYTAGRRSAPLPDADYVAVDGGSALNGPNSLAANTGAVSGVGTLGDGTGTTAIGNPNGFEAPDFGNSVVFTSPTLFAITDPGYAEAGGHVTITAQNDITDVENIPQAKPYTAESGGYLTQLWTAWLFTRSNAVPASSGNTAIDFNADQGVYNPNASHQLGSVHTDLNDGQTTWWVNYGSFDQGVAALGGGDVTIDAGNNITDLSASTVATGRVSGGLSATSLPKLHLSGGGDLSVTAGNDIVAGAYYVALGKGSITAGGSVVADPTWSFSYFDNKLANATQVVVHPSTILAQGDAQIDVSARGSVTIGDVVNPTEMISDVALTVSDDYIANHGGASSLATRGSTGAWVMQESEFSSMSTDSALSVVSTGGDVTLEALPNASVGDDRNALYRTLQTLLPATVAAEALRGSIIVQSSFNQVNSADGTLDLLADENVRLANADDLVGAGAASTIAQASSQEAALATYQTNYTQTVSTFFPVPGLVDAAFDPDNPAAALNAPASQLVLLRATTTASAHIYAVEGDVTNGPLGMPNTSVPDTALPMPVLADLPISVRSGRDILNLQLYAQNDTSSDVTTISAGRDLTYDLPARNQDLTNGPNGLNLIELSGPGSLVVSAGRNLGPFPNAFDSGPSGIETTGDVAWVSSAIDPLLPSEGASVYAFAGVGRGIDDQAVIASYVNPANEAAVSHNYLPELVTYLGDAFGVIGLTEAQAWKRFQSLSTAAQDVFVDQVFFAELQSTQQSGGTPSYQRGYRAVNALFPGAYGYTQDNLAGGTNGSNQLNATGSIDLRSATIQTRRGGDIDLFAPGGNILLGSTSARQIYNEPGLTGVLTLQGGAINVYADQSVIVNQSRILTEEGGDVLVWSSNGDILAGIGAKTSADFPPYTVLYDNDAQQQLDPAGLVTGAGIGALVTLPGQDASLSNAFLIAPRGTVDAGDAGIRVAGNLFVAALHVTNAGNIQVGGSAVGVPQGPSVNVAALTSAAATAAAGEKGAEALQALSNGSQLQQSPSIITIDVVGFGGE